MNLFDWIRRRPAAEPSKRVVTFNDEGFGIVVDGEVCARVAWAQVVEVFAFKRDLFACDEVCLGFRCDASGGYWWVGEEDTGFMELRTEVERRFVGIRRGWFREVAVPAFAESRTTLWGGPSADLRAGANVEPESGLHPGC